MDKDVKAFIMYMNSLSLRSMMIYLARKAQIALLLCEKVIILTRYADFADVFAKELAKMLPERTNINTHAI